jgi:hypothetical protein
VPTLGNGENNKFKQKETSKRRKRDSDGSESEEYKLERTKDIGEQQVATLASTK